MKATGIIAEFNPFHKGHAYLLKQAKEKTKADYLVIIMSGDFVQRGEPAILDKYTRAHMALLSGADLVLELPLRFSCASAEYFANGGSFILSSLGCIDELSFGVEQTSSLLSEQIASVLAEEPVRYQELLQANLKAGMSFPKARQTALEEYLGCSLSLLGTPNNILGIEYRKALFRLHSPIHVTEILRMGEGYHSTELSSFASATAIRKAIADTAAASDLTSVSELLASFLSPECLSVLSIELLQNGFLLFDDFSEMLLYRLLLAQSGTEFSDYFDVGEFLGNRIFQNRYQFHSSSQFADLLKTKNETLLHMNRALLHILLGLKEDPQSQMFPYYTRILAMRKSASPLLHKIKQNSSIPVLTKLSQGRDILLSSDLPDPIKEAAIRQLKETVNGSNLYQMARAAKYNTSFQHEYTRRFTIL